MDHVHGDVPECMLYDFSLTDLCFRMNDLWGYNLTTGIWTWFGGTLIDDFDGGSYGIMGVFNESNWPGSKSNPAHWQVNETKLFLFGGTSRWINDHNGNHDLQICFLRFAKLL
jgi:hypothetical protein